MQAANQYLKDSYMPACNAEFACDATGDGNGLYALYRH